MHYHKNNNLDSFINHFFDSGVKQIFEPQFTKTRIDVNLLEKEKEYVFELAIPNMTKENINISLEENYLKILTDKSVANDEIKPISKEYDFTKSERKLALPKDADRSKINAKHENGVLFISIKKLKGDVSHKSSITIH